ncbi:MAG: hypothetical protein ACHQK8_03685 [Bacteroidia bacterium]
MKKLLLPTKFICVCFLFAFHNLLAAQGRERQASPQQPKPAIDKKQSIKVKPIATDTVRKINRTPLTGTAGNSNSTRKNAGEKTYKSKAIIHRAPEQEKIDSIKNEKMKNKK